MTDRVTLRKARVRNRWSKVMVGSGVRRNWKKRDPQRSRYRREKVYETERGSDKYCRFDINTSMMIGIVDV